MSRIWNMKLERIAVVESLALWAIQILATGGLILSMLSISDCRYVSIRCYNLSTDVEETCEDATSTSFGLFSYDGIEDNRVRTGGCVSYSLSSSAADGGLSHMLPILNAADVSLAQGASVASVVIAVFMTFVALSVKLCFTSKRYFAILMGFLSFLLCVLEGLTFFMFRSSSGSKEQILGNQRVALQMDASSFEAIGAIACYFALMWTSAFLGILVCQPPAGNFETKKLQHENELQLERMDPHARRGSPKQYRPEYTGEYEEDEESTRESAEYRNDVEQAESEMPDQYQRESSNSSFKEQHLIVDDRHLWEEHMRQTPMSPQGYYREKEGTHVY